MNVHTPLPTGTKQNPKMLALRFQAWQHVRLHGDNITVIDLAEAINAQPTRLRRALRDEAWARVLRSTSLDLYEREADRGATTFEADQVARDFVRIDT